MRMNIKENIINNVMDMMSVRFDNDSLIFIKNVLTLCLQEVECEQKKDLPSADVLDNDKILRHYYATKKMEGLSIKSVKTYKFHLEKFFDFVHVPINKVDTNTVRFYLASLSTHTSNSYIDHVRRVLNTFFEFCKDEEYITTNPVHKIKHIKQNKIMKTPYSDVEVEMLRDACVTPREKALVSFLFSTGVRRDEVCKVKMQDINLYERSAIIHGKGGKDRKVYFSARCEKHLKEYIDSKKYFSEYLFSSTRKPYGQLGNEALASIIKKVGERSNVQNVHLHRFRHWFGTYMANRGVLLQDLKEMMGHSKIETTNKYYVFNNQERIKFNYKNNAA